jgi:hypothetical protein
MALADPELVGLCGGTTDGERREMRQGSTVAQPRCLASLASVGGSVARPRCAELNTVEVAPAWVAVGFSVPFHNGPSTRGRRLPTRRSDPGPTTRAGVVSLWARMRRV